MSETNSLLSPQYLETVPCNLCGETKTTPWTSSEGLQIVRCDNCGLTYVNPRLNYEGLKIVYGKDYFDLRTGDQALQKRIKMYKIEIKTLEKLQASGRILDVGCGGGYFLSCLGEQWEKVATEFNPVAAQNARDQFGIDVNVGSFPELGLPRDSFDVVNMRGVIEHFQDPLAYLREAYRVLKPGGIIAINTPNIGSFCARMYRDKYCLIDSMRHIYYFSTQTMSKMLEKAGFQIIQKKYFYLGTPYAKWTDLFRILADFCRRLVGKSPSKMSPAFFDSVLHIYARK